LYSVFRVFAVEGVGKPPLPVCLHFVQTTSQLPGGLVATTGRLLVHLVQGRQGGALGGAPCATSVFIAASSFQSSAATAALIFLAICSNVACLSIFGLHAQPAFFDGREQGGHFVEDGRVQADAGGVQAPGAVVVQAAEVFDDLAAVVEV
jgi:hypothetical protein